MQNYWIVDRHDQALRCHVLGDGVFVEVATHRLARGQTPPVHVSYADREVALVLDQLFQ